MIGETIGNFKLLSRLGRGGMGEVFLAEHTTVQNKVAVKILHAEISRDRDQVQRFFNEARVVSRVKHAGIVQIFDSGMYQDHAYLIMELLEGESLASRLERGRMSATQIAGIARQIASVLDATHRAGITHRDLKPDNIFLVPDEELATRERVKILDFGIAKLTGTLAGATPKTQGTMGTPSYMAPEQWGDSSQVDWHADAYSLGCVAFEMACGRPPFVASNIAQAYAKHLHEAPPSPRGLSPDLPLALDALIVQLLAKQPQDRATSMADLVVAFDAIAEGDHAPLGETLGRDPGWSATLAPASLISEPVVAPRTTLGAGEVSFRSPARRRGGLVLGAIVGGCAIAVAIGLALRHPPDEPPVAVAPRPPAVIDAAAPPIDAASLAIAIDAAPARVTLRVDTEPAGADVFRVTDSVRIGQTPLALAMDPGAGELVLLVKKVGYRDERLALPLAADLTRRVALVRRAGTKPVIVPATVPVKPVVPVVPDPRPGRKKGDVSDNPYGP